jgi:serine/threonine-protein kinase
LTGTTIAGRYDLGEPLGEGGAATVYHAHDRVHDRPVAVKVMHPEVAVTVGFERFQREITVISRLSHPHIVPMLDAGETADSLFYVMPVIAGNSVRHALRARGRLELDLVLRIARDVALALDHAHAQGIIHRDIKPENILLAGGSAVVTDFGIAKLVGDATVDSLTRTGIAIGTVLYMSPEQANDGPIDQRADIYALGCLVYELLVGAPPFGGRTPQQVLLKHAVDPVPLVSAARPELPIALDDAIARAMAKDPADRPATATAFVEALEAARGTQTTSGEGVGTWRTSGARPSGVGAAAAGGARRPPIGWLATGLGVIVAGAVAALSLRRRAPDALPPSAPVAAPALAKALAVLPFDDVSRARDQEYFATGIADELLTALARLPGVRVAARTSAYALRGTTLSAPEIGRRLKVGRLLTGSIRREGDQLRVTAQLVDAAADTVIWQDTFDTEVRDVFAVQEAIAQRIAGRLEVTVGAGAPLVDAGTRDPEAYQLYLRGRQGWRTRTATSLREAVDQYQRAIARDSGFASAWAGLADTYTVIGLNFYGRPGEQFALARTAARRALAIAPANADAQAAVATLLMYVDHDWDGADAAFRRAIALDPSNPTTYYFYSLFLTVVARHDSSMAMARRARELDPTSPVMAQGPGLSAVMAGDPQGARAPLEAAIAIEPRYYFPHAWYAVALARTGAPDSAIAEARRARALAPDNVLVRAFAGQVFALVGRADSARAIAAAVEADARTRAVPHVMLARLYSILGDVPAARAQLAQARRSGEAQLTQLRSPGFEAMRDDPLYREMLAAYRLP